MLEFMESRGRKVLDQLDLWDSGQFPEFASIDSFEPCVSTNTEYFPDKCTSPDGQGGHDCCASWDWAEPKTCAFGYKVKKLGDDCWYTCVEGLSTGIIAGISIGVIAFLVVATIVVRKCAARKETASSENTGKSTPTANEEAEAN